jgi:hypothetical protein
MKQMTITPVASIKIYDISRQYFVHAKRKGLISCFTQQMKMIRHQRPGIYIHGTILCNTLNTLDKVIAIHIIKKYFSFLNTPADHMMQNTRGI